MNLGIFSLTFIIALSGMVSSAEPIAQATVIVQVAELKLLPMEVQKRNLELEKTLTGTSWVRYGTRNILGEGSDSHVQFSTINNGTMLMMTPSCTYHPGVGRPREPDAHVGGAMTYTTIGPVLRYESGDMETVAVHKNKLIFNAVLPLGNGIWYQVRNGHEFRYEFADDPFLKDAGRVMVHRRIGDEVLQLSAHFTVHFWKERGIRTVSFKDDNIEKQHRIDGITFDVNIKEFARSAEGEYILEYKIVDQKVVRYPPEAKTDE